MSIEKRVVPFSRSFRTFIKTRADMSKSIKDLKDLRVLRRRAGYRHSGPKGPEENQRRFFYSASDGEGQALALREGAAFFRRSAGALGGFHTRIRAGFPRELHRHDVCFAHCSLCSPDHKRVRSRHREGSPTRSYPPLGKDEYQKPSGLSL